jgi:hypothetical protein
MMNPFRRAEKIGSLVGWTLPVALLAILLAGGLLGVLGDAIQGRWRRAKRRWDEKNSQTR